MKGKICTNATLTEQTVKKQTKPSKTFKENSLSLSSFPLSREGFGGSTSRLSYTTLHGLPSPPSFCFGEVPSNFIQNPQCNIDSSTVVLGCPTIFFPFALAGKACLEVFPEAFCLHG